MVSEITQPYWIINHDVYQEMLETQINTTWLEHSFPLFTDEFFDELIEVTPWVIAATDTILSLPQRILSQGILVFSPNEQPLFEHLQSLLLALYQGERVLFRFYDPCILHAIANTLSDDRLALLFGCIEKVQLIKGDAVIEIMNPYPQRYVYQASPWWVINDKDLSMTDNLDHYAYSVSRRLWEKLPEMMMSLPPEDRDLKLLFQLGQQHTNKSDIEWWVLGQLIANTQTPITLVSQRLLFDLEEQQSLQSWVKE